jgi:hypothetical protein
MDIQTQETEVDLNPVTLTVSILSFHNLRRLGLFIYFYVNNALDLASSTVKRSLSYQIALQPLASTSVVPTSSPALWTGWRNEQTPQLATFVDNYTMIDGIVQALLDLPILFNLFYLNN